MVVLCTRLPCESRTTTLQPVRNPGSMAITRFCPSGAERSSCRRFSANTPIASSSAFSLAAASSSVSIDGRMSRLSESATAASIYVRVADPGRMNRRQSASVMRSVSASIEMRRIPSSSPRRMARNRCDEMLRSGDAASK